MNVSRHRLMDGSEALIRPIAPTDKERLKARFNELGADSRYRRFLGAKASLTDRELVDVTGLTTTTMRRSSRNEQLLATFSALLASCVLRDTRRSLRLLAPSSTTPNEGGLGRGLLHQLANRAREEGITRFTGVALVQNAAILALLRELGPTVATHVGSGTAKLAVNLTTDHAVGGLARAA